MAVLWKDKNIRKTTIETIQINLGNRCNQACIHCHIEASPRGKNNMDAVTAEKMLDKLLKLEINNVEFTGGAPELNPHLKMFIKVLNKENKKVAVRTNLTVLDIPRHSSFIKFYRRYGVKIIASLPSCFDDITDKQRGKGVFHKSIKVLKQLNSIGYGSKELPLELVYNPADEHLPPSQTKLEEEYKKLLTDIYGISFNRLIAITNAPVGGFKKFLTDNGKFDKYMKLLVNNFNDQTLEHIMCRHLLTVDYQGYVYDCDFNLALGIRVKDYEKNKFWEINFEDFNPEITCEEHCYACTVGMGSSCHGSLMHESDFNTQDAVKQYYGIGLKKTTDLKTQVCSIIKVCGKDMENIRKGTQKMYTKSDDETLRTKLTPIQYKVTQKDGTEPPFQNEYWDNKREGIYVDIVSGEPLFSSLDKYDSGTGWPSFTKPLQPENIVEKEDKSPFMKRVEVRSKHGNSHLGHVFNDGPPPTGFRYCMNSAALRFIPKEELEKEGYGEYLKLFKKSQ